MVRAGVVAHPEQWAWCGYDELVGKRQRYRLVDRERLLELLGGCDAEGFAANYAAMVDEDIERGRLVRDPCWSESIAVGDEAFVAKVEAETWNRSKLERSSTQPGRYGRRGCATPSIPRGMPNETETSDGRGKETLSRENGRQESPLSPDLATPTCFSPSVFGENTWFDPGTTPERRKRARPRVPPVWRGVVTNTPSGAQSDAVPRESGLTQEAKSRAMRSNGKREVSR